MWSWKGFGDLAEDTLPVSSHHRDPPPTRDSPRSAISSTFTFRWLRCGGSGCWNINLPRDQPGTRVDWGGRRKMILQPHTCPHMTFNTQPETLITNHQRRVHTLEITSVLKSLGEYFSIYAYLQPNLKGIHVHFIQYEKLKDFCWFFCPEFWSRVGHLNKWMTWNSFMVPRGFLQQILVSSLTFLYHNNKAKTPTCMQEYEVLQNCWLSTKFSSSFSHDPCSCSPGFD